MHTNDVQEILALIAAHKWAAAVAIVLFILLRLLRSDVNWFFTLPPILTFRGRTIETRRLKPLAIVVIGLAAGVLEKVADGAPMKVAFADAFVVMVLPIFMHQVGIESIRDGKELPMPKFPPNGAALLLAVALALTVAGCAGSFEEARLVGLKTAAPLAKAAAAERTPDEVKYCRDLDDARTRHGAAAKALAGFAGVAGSGAGIYGALEQERASRGLLLGGALGSVVAAAFATAEFAMAEGAGAAWARDCK